MAKARSAVKELFFLLVIFGSLLGALFAYTGVWPPAVIVESGSMMHRDSEVTYGRFGTIDPGDMVLVKSVDGAEDVHTWADRQSRHYGEWGDVVVYYPGGEESFRGMPVTPIIHRAMAWVTVTGAGDDRQYAVHWASDVECPVGSEARDVDDGRQCVFGERGITIPEIGLHHCTDACGESGLITKGDNPVTNRQPDQVSRISRGMVQEDWIVGKARGEIPWLGLIKLALGPDYNEQQAPQGWVLVGKAYAPKDLWVMLGVSLFLLIGVPIGFDAYKALKEREQRREEGSGDDPGGPGGPGGGGGAGDGPGGPGDPPAVQSAEPDSAPRDDTAAEASATAVEESEETERHTPGTRGPTSADDAGAP